MRKARAYRERHYLDRPALFACIPMSARSITIGELLAAAGLSFDSAVAVRSCVQQWKRWGAVEFVGFAKGRKGMWRRLWKVKQLTEYVESKKAVFLSGECFNHDTLPALDHEAACSKVGSLAALVAQQMAAPQVKGAR